MKVSLREDVCASTDYELSVEQDGLVLSNKRETMNLRYRDMDRFWFRHFGSTAVAFVIEMSDMVYEGNFLKPGDAKDFTAQLNQKIGDSIDVIFNMNQRKNQRFVL